MFFVIATFLTFVLITVIHTILFVLPAGVIVLLPINYPITWFLDLLYSSNIGEHAFIPMIIVFCIYWLLISFCITSFNYLIIKKKTNLFNDPSQ
ncbi:hypothetical protein KS4_36890 [Poriferisphaera corsica]|uniref:Uncharacterized protein n=1 Tax=Poriferisphaera corsica TaxID=2528020 RepID=A0A517YZD5_9BACT|nr:hypothetical protein [Poriferisphaera corsica]QDU35606.1 hypothetical protein KS4_36890 [Poriferisphaera corsica]